MDRHVGVALVLKEGGSLAPEKPISWCEGRMACYQILHYERFVSQIPRTESTGRTQKFQFKK